MLVWGIGLWGATMASEDDASKKVVRVAVDAAADWLIRAGKIRRRDEFKIDKTFRDYDISHPEFIDFSRAVIVSVENSTGQSFHLPVDVGLNLSGGSVGNFLTALPGQSSTPSSGPLKRPPRK
jgi:hypothetical protein